MGHKIAEQQQPYIDTKSLKYSFTFASVLFIKGVPKKVYIREFSI